MGVVARVEWQAIDAKRNGDMNVISLVFCINRHIAVVINWLTCVCIDPEGALSTEVEHQVGIEVEVAIPVEREVVQAHTPVSKQGGSEMISIETWLREPRRSKKKI